MSTSDSKQRVRDKGKSDLIYFGKVLSPPESSDTFYLPTPPFHHRVGSLLIDKTIKRALVVAPRGTAKSVLSVRAAMHHYLYENTELDSVIVIQSKTLREAKKRLWTIKNIIKYNKIYRDLYGKHSDRDFASDGSKMADTWSKDYIKFRYNGHWITIASCGMEQQVRGILEDDTRVTLYLLDDPEDEKNTLTEEQIDKNYDIFLAGVATLDKRLGYVRVIGTPIVQGCMVDRIMQNPTGWTVQWYSAEQIWMVEMDCSGQRCIMSKT